MPSPDYGYSAAEVIQMLKDFTGNQSDNFENYVSNELPLAEFQYCKGHDWSFLYKLNLSLTVATGTDEYNLNPATVGHYISASDVINIFDVTNNCLLRKTTLDEIRRIDPNASDGSTNAGIKMWAPAGDNRIVVWPKVFSTTTLKVDGKITPFVYPQTNIGGLTYTVVAPYYDVAIAHINPGTNNASLSVSVSGHNIIVSLATDGSAVATSTNTQVAAAIAASSTASALVSASVTTAATATTQASAVVSKYFNIPYRYQHAFIEYLKGQVLERENDTRASNQKAYAKMLRDQDIEDDQSNLGDTILPRIRGYWEQHGDGMTNDLSQAYDLWAFYGD